MKRTIGIAALAVALASSGAAYGADIYGNSTKDAPASYMPAITWTGFYVGVTGGWATGEWDGTLAYTDPKTGKTDDAGFDNPNRSIDGDGWNAGLTIGANRQIGKIVLGLEADVSATDFEGGDTFTTDDYKGGFVKKHDLSMEYFGTVRARLGYDAGRFMPYVTGGLAWAQTEADLEISYPCPPCYGPKGKTSNASAEETHVGWVAGAGIETVIGSGWTFKIEYLHVDLGTEDYAFKGKTATGQPFNTDSFESDLNFDVIRAGLNYRIGGTIPGLE